MGRMSLCTPSAGNVRAAALPFARNLVYFVDEHDAVVFGAIERLRLYRVLVHELGGLLLERDIHRLADGKAALLALFLEHVAENAADADGGAARHQLHRLGNVHDVHFDDEIVVRALAQPVQKVGLEKLLGRLSPVLFLGLDENFQNPALRCGGGLGLDLFLLFRLDQAIGAFRQIADHALDVLADVAHFRVLGRLHLDEGGLDQLGQPPRDLRLAHARGPLS